MKHYGFVLSAFLFAQVVIGQEVTQIIPPSPNAASLSKYAEIPVSYYSGLPNISIPLYEISEKDISVPIALTYHASGIKVNQEATWVGLGWDLQAGGVISRMVMNKDDFDPAYNYFNEDVPLFTSPTTAPKEFSQAGCNPQTVNTATGEMGEVDLSRYLSSTAIDPYEFEPDQYSFNFLNYSGKFVLERNRQAVLAQQTKMDIQCDELGKSWTIKAENGYVYEFNQFESYTDNLNSRPTNTAWYLTKITSTTGSFVTFHYDQDNNNTNPLSDLFEEQSQVRTLVGRGTPGTPEEGNVCQRPVVREPIRGKSYESLTLSYIDFSNGRVKFDYNEDRDDLQGGKRLNAVQIFKKGGDGVLATSPYREYIFSYDYFVGTIDDDIKFEPGDYTTKRLKLLSVQEVSSDEEKNAHMFSYYEDRNVDKLPSKGSFARDHWGYFNGALNNTTMVPAFKGNIYLDDPNGVYTEIAGANRETNPLYMRAFSLKDIKYPTTGHTTFDYETHDFDLSKSARNIIEPRSDVIVNSDPIRLFLDKNEASATKPLDLTDAVPRTNGTVRVTLKAAFRLSNPYDPSSGVISSSTNAYFELYQPNGARISAVSITDGTCENNACEYENSYILRPGVYQWKASIAAPDIGIESISASYFFDKYVEPSPEKKSLPHAGGLRIKTITDYDGQEDSPKMVRNFSYNYKEDRDEDGEDELYSYGRRMAYPVYQRYGNRIGYFTNGDVYECLWFIRTASSSVALNGTAGGSVVGYDQVSVTYGPDGKLGKSTFQYYNVSDVVYFYDRRRPPGLSNLVSNRNGLLKQQTDFSLRLNRYQKVKEVVNDYQLLKNRTVYGVRNEDIGYFSNLADCGFRLFFYPALQSDWVQLKSTTERLYDDSNPSVFVTTRTEYQYEEDPQHYQVLRRSIEDSKNRERTIDYQYPLDITGNEYGSDLLRGKHMHSVVVKEENKVNENLLQTTERSYTSTASGIVVPQWQKVYPNGERNPIQVNFLYDEQGNLVQERKAKDRPVSYVWGYHQKMPIARIDGVPYSTVKAEIERSPSLTSLWTGPSLGNTDPDGSVRNQLTTLKERLPGVFLMTGYTYDPLVGITSMTAPNGLNRYYRYDDLGRLQNVQDHQGRFTDKLLYHYQGQPHPQ